MYGQHKIKHLWNDSHRIFQLVYNIVYGDAAAAV